MPNPKVFPHLAVFSGPTATIENTEPLVTSDKARNASGLPLRTTVDGEQLGHDTVRPQRLAAPVVVYIEAFTAHPLERDAAQLYAPPDGYINEAGIFVHEKSSPNDKPVYEARLEPSDGLYYLPYMARQVDGSPWDYEGAGPTSGPEATRQTFYPDASRLFEEIDRFGIDASGMNCQLSSRASFDFFRAAPSGGYLQGMKAEERTDLGSGDLPPEVGGRDFFYYRPAHLARNPARPTLARITNTIQDALASGAYGGGLWLEGSPNIEETAYWLNLLIDTALPIACSAAQRSHGSLGNDGDRNIVSSVEYLCSRVWAGVDGKDNVGVVVIQEEQIFTARQVQKADARPGGYIATGGDGGVIGSVGDAGIPQVNFRPTRRHTHASEVNISRLPVSTTGVRSDPSGAEVRLVSVPLKGPQGELLDSAIPKVTVVKYVRYGMDDYERHPSSVVEVEARLERNLRHFPLSGFVLEGSSPYAVGDDAEMAALRRAVAHGVPVACTGRGNSDGEVPPGLHDITIAASNLTSTKARLLLMACIMRFGVFPPARDPANPSPEEWARIRQHVERFQEVFDSH